MKYQAILGGLVLTLAVAGSAPLVQAGKNCEDLLDNNAYRCEITFEGNPGESFEDCLIFDSEGLTLGDFDLFVVGLDEVLGCSCEGKGKKFDNSKQFVCVGGPEGDNVSVGDDVSFSGKVKAKGKKIKNGQVVFEDGGSYTYKCELDPTCELK